MTGRSNAARILTVVLLAGALGVAVVRSKRAPAQSAAPSPEDAIYAMLDAARNGDVNAYLESYTDSMRENLRQSLVESTPAGFAKYLKDSNAAFKGVAVSPPEPVNDDGVKVRVEYVYADRNEVQFVYLKKKGSGWKIFRVDGAERVKTLVPYGSPVTE